MPATVHVQLQLRILGDDGTVFTDTEILRLKKSAARLEALGLSLQEGKTLQEHLQRQVVTAQAQPTSTGIAAAPPTAAVCVIWDSTRSCSTPLFGNVVLSSPRFYRCGCHPADSQTFSPLAELFTEHVAPELLYLETRWASLISFGLTVACSRTSAGRRHHKPRDGPPAPAQVCQPARGRPRRRAGGLRR